MSLEICDCSNITLGDTGRPDCDVSYKVLAAQYHMFTIDSEGNRNKIDLDVDTIDQEFIDAKVNHVDPTKRWYFTGQLYNIEGERAESKFFEASNGDKFKTKQGSRGRSYDVYGSPALMQEWVKFGCPQISAFDVDDIQNLRGSIPDTEDGNLYPTRLQKGSVDIIYIEPNEEQLEGFKMSYNYDPREKDSCLRSIAKANITADLLATQGLLGITAEYSNISTTGVTITMKTKYDSIDSLIPMEGLLKTDFFDVFGGTADSLYNVTDDAIVTIVTFVESAPGVYDLTFAVETASDVIRVTPVKTGFNFAKVTAKTFAIPV